MQSRFLCLIWYECGLMKMSLKTLSPLDSEEKSMHLRAARNV